MNYLGLAFHADYGIETSVSRDKPIDWLREKAWFWTTKLKDYNETKIFAALKEKSVIYACGASEKEKTWIFFNTYSGGHAWVIDGYIRGPSKTKTTIFSIVTGDGTVKKTDSFTVIYSTQIRQKSQTKSTPLEVLRTTNIDLVIQSSVQDNTTYENPILPICISNQPIPLHHIFSLWRTDR